MKTINIDDQKHILLYIRYCDTFPCFVITASEHQSSWYIYYWDFFLNEGDTLDIRYALYGSGGVMPKEIEAPAFNTPTEIWISDRIKLIGKGENIILLTKHRGNPFKDSCQATSYYYCEICDKYYDSSDEFSICDHVDYDECGELRYKHSNELA